MCGSALGTTSGMAHPSAAPTADARILRFRLGWSGDSCAGSRLLSQRKAATSDSQDAAAFEAHGQGADRAVGPNAHADERT